MHYYDYLEHERISNDMIETKAYLNMQQFVYENWFVYHDDGPKSSSRKLDLCGETLIHDVYSPELLEQSFRYISTLPKPLTIEQTLWQIRLVHIYGSLLNKIPDVLFDMIGCYIGIGLPTFFYLEMFRAFQAIGQTELASKCLKQIENLPQLNFSGKLGKRTKFQRDYIAQLVVEVSNVSQETNDFCKTDENLLSIEELNDISLTDDLLLSEIYFKDVSKEETCKINAINEILILALLDNQQLESSAEQDQEFTSAIITYLLNASQNSSLCGKMLTLYLRCLIDRKATRKIERAIAQLSVLLEFQPKSKQSAFYCFYLVNIPCKQRIRLMLGELLLQIGQFTSALKQFECLNDWSGMISAYKGLGRPTHAVAMLDKKIKDSNHIDEYRKLLCSKAEIKCDESIFENLESNNNMNTHSWRIKANICFKKCKYEQAIHAFQLCLQMNSSQADDWFLLGLSYFKINQYDKAKLAFQRHCALEPESANGWNNLASSLIKLGEKSRAHKLLSSEGTRLDYNNWRVWENFLLVSIDCNQWGDAIFALGRIIDIRNDNINEENDDILMILSEEQILATLDAKLKSRLTEIVRRLLDMKATQKRLESMSRLTESFDEKIECMRKALSISLLNDDDADFGDISLKLAEICLKAKASGQSQRAIQLALVSFKSIRNRKNTSLDKVNNIVEQLTVN